MSFINANIIALSLMLGCILLIKYNILKHVIIALFLTGIVQWFISGYMDLMVISLMLEIFGITVIINKA